MPNRLVTPERLIRPEILALRAYRVAPSQGLIKLDAMENPYPWPGELLDEWLALLRQASVSLNRYPAPDAPQLKQRLAATFALPEGAEVLLGNGSDELIQLLALAVAGPGDAGSGHDRPGHDRSRVLLAPEPSFVMYRMVAAFVGMRFVGVPLRQDFGLDLDAMLTAIERHRPALVFLAYPNNPSGNRFEPAAIAHILDATPGLVVIDEAYYAFSEHSFLPEIMAYPNLLLMRTVSKIGLAGLRLGFVAGAERWMQQLEKLRLPYNINTLTQISVDFALRHHAVLLDQAARLRQARAVLSAALAELPGISVFPSETNFILIKTPPGQAQRLFQALLDGGVLIKNLDGGNDLLRDCLRVTVGLPNENQRLLDILGEAL